MFLFCGFPYLKWDFGYKTYMPQRIYLDNVKLGDNCSGTQLYICTDISDNAFVKPADFYQDTTDLYDGEGNPKKVVTIDGTERNITRDDIYYGQYQITQYVCFRNMNALPICRTSSSYLYKTLSKNCHNTWIEEP